MEKSVTLNTPEIIGVLQRELKSANLVVLIGGPCSGKSWLIAQVVPNEAVIDKSIHALRGDNARVSLGALDKWAARTQPSIAVDEVQLLDQRELFELITVSVSCRKGVVIATQQECLIPKQVISEILNHGKQVVFIKMHYWNSNMSLPKWQIEKRITN